MGVWILPASLEKTELKNLLNSSATESTVARVLPFSPLINLKLTVPINYSGQVLICVDI